jgi:raffinose/stachyose/melibiose transport system permease protein
VALFPIFMIIINSFKTRDAIFRYPFQTSHSGNIQPDRVRHGLFARQFRYLFRQQLPGDGLSLIFALFIGSMAAFALSEYDFKGNALLGLYLSFGIMIPIRLGTVSIRD